jgi:hypothetical protein
MIRTLDRERPLRAARTARGGCLGHAMLKTFVSGCGSSRSFEFVA